MKFNVRWIPIVSRTECANERRYRQNYAVTWYGTSDLCTAIAESVSQGKDLGRINSDTRSRRGNYPCSIVDGRPY